MLRRLDQTLQVNCHEALLQSLRAQKHPAAGLSFVFYTSMAPISALGISPAAQNTIRWSFSQRLRERSAEIDQALATYIEARPHMTRPIGPAK